MLSNQNTKEGEVNTVMSSPYIHIYASVGNDQETPKQYIYILSLIHI